MPMIVVISRGKISNPLIMAFNSIPYLGTKIWDFSTQNVRNCNSLIEWKSLTKLWQSYSHLFFKINNALVIVKYILPRLYLEGGRGDIWNYMRVGGRYSSKFIFWWWQ